MHYQAPRHGRGARQPRPSFPVVLASATPSIESHVNARSGRYALRALARPLLGRRAAGRGGHRPAPASRPSEGKWLSPVLVEAVTETLAKQAAGAAVPQPPRLRAAHAVPLLRPSHRLPAVHGLAGRAPLPPPAQLPPLRLLAADPGEVPQVRRAGRARRLRPGRRAHRRGGGRALSRGARGAALLRPGARR